MDWIMDLDIQRFLREDTQRRKTLDDRFLSEYARGFSGPRNATGLLDAGPPKAWVDAWYKLQKKQAQTDGATNISGNTFQFDADTGNLTIKGHMGAIQIMKDDLLKVISFLMMGPPDAMPVQGTLNPNQNAYEFSPQLKERQERNLAELERWAKASSKTYPKSR